MEWAGLAEVQAGPLSRAQLRELGVNRGFVRHRLESGRWVRLSASVIATTTGPVSWEQRLWLAVLHGGPTAIVGGLTAATVHGLRGWDREEIQVLVGLGARPSLLDGVAYTQTRRPLTLLAAPRTLPVARVEPAILLFASTEPNLRTAQGAVAAVVQQRLTSVSRLRTWLRRLRPLPRSGLLHRLLDDLEGGAHSLAEVDLHRVCRRFGIAPPRANRPRFDRAGRRRFTDAEWDLPDGRVLVLEVDGAFHDNVREAAEDRRRNRGLARLDRITISCSAWELRTEPESVVEDLIALGVPLVKAG